MSASWKSRIPIRLRNACFGLSFSLVLSSLPLLSLHVTPAVATSSDQYQATILADNPEAYWPFEAVGQFLQGTDASGHGHLIGASAPVADSPLGGSDTSEPLPPRFQLQDISTLPEHNDNFTVEFWLKPNSVQPAARQAILDLGAYTGFGFFFGMLISMDTNGELLLGGHGGFDDFSSDTGYRFPVAGRWYHIVISVGPNNGYGGAPSMAYVNGQATGAGFSGPVVMGGTPPGPYGNDIVVGVEGNTSEGAPRLADFSGEMDELAYYTHALTASQALAHFNAAVAAPSSPSNAEVDPFPIDELPTVASIPANVNTATGSFWRSFSDLSIPGRGVPLGFDRTYDSSAAASDGPLGHGWTHGYNVALTTDGSGNVTVHEENGSTITFSPSGTGFTAPTRVLASLSANADGTLTLTRKNQVKLVFNSTGQLIKEIDRNGYATALNYSTAQLVSVTDPAGRALTFTSDSAGHITQVQDPAGRSASFFYDSNGNLTSVKDIGGGTTTFTYDAAHRMVTMADPRGQLLQIGYDSAGRVVSELDPLKRATGLSYATGGTTITLPDGSVRLDQYTTNELTGRTDAFGTSLAGTWAFAYDPATLGVTSSTNPDQHISKNTYDAMGNVLTHTDPLGGISRYSYDTLNDLITVNDPIGQQVLVNTYDAKGNLTQVTTGQIAVTVYTYDPNQAEDVVATTDPNHNVWHYGYDSVGNRISASDPLGGTMTAMYDSAGRMLSSISRRGNQPGVNPTLFTTRYAYDAFGDLTQVTDPLGDITKFQFDANRNQTMVTDPDAHSTKYTFNGDNEQEDATRADGTHVTTAYDAMGRVIIQTDPLKNSVGYGYDLRGRLSSQADAFNHTTQFQYSAAGNLLVAIDPRLRKTTYGYDPADNLISITYSDGTTPNVVLGYDADGRRISMQDGSGTSRYGYDTLSRLIASLDGTGQSIGYGYDLNGNLTSLTYPGGSQQVTRSYDAANHLASVTDWLHNSSIFKYDADGHLIQATYPNTVVSIYGYDTADRLQFIDASNGGTGRFRRLTYSPDAAGLVRGQTDTISQIVKGVSTQTTITTTNGYDALNRLTSVKVGSTQGTLSYDAADNLTSRSIGGAFVTSTYDAGHELKTQISNGASYSFSYDASGNRVQRAASNGVTLAYTYDQANRLSQIGTTFYAYNGDGLRTSKTFGAGSPQPFIWELGDGSPVLIHDASASYVTGPGGRPIEQIMPDGTVFYLLADELGSTETITNGSGQPVTEYAYPDPYGSVTASQSGTPQTPFLYAGMYRDSESGLQYMLSRYYDPTSGNFLTRDPGAGVTRQPYSYAGDSPLNAGGLSGQLPSLSGTPEPTPDLLHQVAAALVQGTGDFLGETHDDLVSGDPLHVTLGVANSFVIAASIMDAAAGVAATGRAVLARSIPRGGLTEAFHFGFQKNAVSIEKNGLIEGTFATPTRGLSSLQAHIELGLPPNRGLPDLVVRIDLVGLREAGYEIPNITRVSSVAAGDYGRIYSVPGGGFEMQFPYPIPPEFVQVLR